MSSNPVPLNIHRAGERCTLNLSRAQSPPVGVVVRRGEKRLKMNQLWLSSGRKTANLFEILLHRSEKATVVSKKYYKNIVELDVWPIFQEEGANSFECCYKEEDQ
ncbi:hypothetical protein TNCV_3761281 [Trichonephila clavipes]|nr:hypothetical protein TNCV_3761281 [Trichonephila clavipes]